MSVIIRLLSAMSLMGGCYLCWLVGRCTGRKSTKIAVWLVGYFFIYIGIINLL